MKAGHLQVFASAKPKHPKVCSFSHWAILLLRNPWVMQKLQGRIKVIWSRTDSLGVGQRHRKRGDITGHSCMSRDKGRGRNGFYKLVPHPKPCAEHSGFESLGTRSTWDPVMPLLSSVTLDKSLTPSEYQDPHL